VADPHSFGRYRVTGTLGAGAMGEVYAAIDEVLGREVAVKTLRGHPSELAARVLDERFRLEARAIAALHHPGVVQVFDIDLSADPPYLVMERVAGPSLRERLAVGALGLDDATATLWATRFAENSRVWPSATHDAVFGVAETADAWTLYAVDGGRLTSLGTIGRPVFVLGVSEDLGRVAVSSLDYRADAWLSKVVVR